MSASGTGVDETWYSCAIPILKAVRSFECSGDQSLALQIGFLADRTGLEPRQVAVEVERLLAGGYLSGQLAKLKGDVRSWRIGSARVAPAGARATGLWPSDDPYEALLALLDRRLAEAPDEDTRSRLRKFRDGITGLARDVGSNLLASVFVELGRGGL